MSRSWLSLVAVLWACQGGAPAKDSGPGSSTGTEDSGEDTGETEAFTCPEADEPGDLPDEWTLLQRPVGGDFLHMVEAADAPLRVFAGSTMNGLYRSDDGGQAWTKQPFEVTHIAGQIAVDPTDADVIFVTTGELHRSTMGGMGWERTGFGLEAAEGQRVRGLVFDGPELVILDSEGGVWRSADHARTIEQVGTIDLAPPPPHGFDESLFDVDESYAWLALGEDALFAAHQGSALYRSKDGGQSWETLETGDFQVITLGADGDTVWVATAFELLVSEDGGDSFTRYDTLEERLMGGTLLDSGELVVVAEDRVFELGDGVILERTTVDGAHGLRQPLTLSDGTLLLGDQDGMYRSTDDAETFELSADGVEVNDLGPLLAHSECASLVWTGTQCERGLFESSDHGDGLVFVDEYMHYVMVLEESPARPWEIWVTTDDMLKRSLDLGQTWERMDEETLDVHLHGLAIHPTDPELILVGSVGSGTAADERARVFRSEDHGETWADSSEGLPETQESLHALHFVEADPSVVLAGTFRGGDMGHSTGEPGIGMFRSTDLGKSWSQVGLDGLDNVPVFTECQGRLYAATNLGVLTSDDLGESWSEALSTDTEVLSVACRGDTVLALETATPWRSDDAGQSWSEWTEGMDPLEGFFRSMPQVAIGADGEVVYAAIPGAGLYRRPL